MSTTPARVGEPVPEPVPDSALVTAELTPEQILQAKLKRRRAEVEAKRAANTATAEARKAERELALLDDEEACEEAARKAYENPDTPPGRCIGPGCLEGAGWTLFRWPDTIVWTRFQDKGILKKDGLTTALADDLTTRCLLYPTAEKWKEYRQTNPTASMKIAVLITEAMNPSDEASGKGFTSSLNRR